MHRTVAFMLFVVVAALAVGLDENAGGAAVAAATASCIAMAALVYASYSVVFSLGGAMKTYQRFRRWIDGSVAGFFAVAGVGLVRSAFTEQA